MADDRFITRVGKWALRVPISVSAGVVDAFKMLRTNALGHIDPTFMPPGAGVDVRNLVHTEAVVAGDLINIWDDAGVTKARLADASNGRVANGFAEASVIIGATGNVLLDGVNGNVSGLTRGTVQYLSTTIPGKLQEVEPTGTGELIQEVGFSMETTELSFEFSRPVTIE